MIDDNSSMARGGVKLYTTSGEMSEKVIQGAGKHIDRNTRALFSFGRLSPIAIPFKPMSEPYFFERKASLMRGVNDMKRVFDIANRRAVDVMNQFEVRNGTNQLINMGDLVDRWTQETTGELIWGRNNADCSVPILDSDGQIVCLPFMRALNRTSKDLRFYANKFWNRVYFPLAAWPVTKEARRLNFNVKVLHDQMRSMMSSQEEGSVARNVQQENDATGIPFDMTLDDLITATIAGLDSVKSTVMGTIWHVLEDENAAWKEGIMAEIKKAMIDPSTMYSNLGRCEKLSAMIQETMCLEPQGSLINNEVVQDFDLEVGNKSYRIKSGARIATCIHALHQNEHSWKKDILEKTAPLGSFDPSRFLDYGQDIVGSKCFMPFGRGINLSYRFCRPDPVQVDHKYCGTLWR